MTWILDKLRELKTPLPKGISETKKVYIPQLNQTVEEQRKPEEVEQELLDRALDVALSAEAGMLKPMGIAKLTRYMGAFPEEAKRQTRVLLEAMRVPQSEFGRIKDISYAPITAKGSYIPAYKTGHDLPVEGRIELNPTKANPTTIWHEFAHARTWFPPKKSVIRSLNQGETEPLVEQLNRAGVYPSERYSIPESDLAAAVKSYAKMAYERFSDPEYIYHHVAPTEDLARKMEVMTSISPRGFNQVYLWALENALRRADLILSKFR